MSSPISPQCVSLILLCHLNVAGGIASVVHWTRKTEYSSTKIVLLHVVSPRFARQVIFGAAINEKIMDIRIKNKNVISNSSMFSNK